MTHVTGIVKRLREPLAWTYLLVAGLAIVVAMAGAESGAFIQYFLVAAFFVVCFVYPTILGWWIAFLSCISASAVTLFVAVRDIKESIAGSRPNVFVDASDSIGFLIWLGILLTTSYLVWRMRPMRIPPQSSISSEN